MQDENAVCSSAVVTAARNRCFSLEFHAVSIGMPEEPYGIPQAARGDVVVECVRNSAEEETRATKEKEAGKNARFHSHWLEKMRLYGVVMCAGTCTPAEAVGGDGRSAPLRVQGHAECGHVGDRWGGVARWKDARGFRTCTPMCACRTSASRNECSYIPLHRGSRDIVACLAAEGRRLFSFCDLSNSSRAFVKFKKIVSFQRIFNCTRIVFSIFMIFNLISRPVLQPISFFISI